MNAQKAIDIEWILGNQNYLPNSGLYKQVRKQLERFSKDTISQLRGIIEQKCSDYLGYGEEKEQKRNQRRWEKEGRCQSCGLNPPLSPIDPRYCTRCVHDFAAAEASAQ
jgi:hypothetical protein